MCWSQGEMTVCLSCLSPSGHSAQNIRGYHEKGERPCSQQMEQLKGVLVIITFPLIPVADY